VLIGECRAFFEDMLEPYFLVRVLMFIICLESLYIFTGLFSQEFICDDLRMTVQATRKDYQRAQLVIKTLTLSCNETEYITCLKDVRELNEKWLRARMTCEKKISTLQNKLTSLPPSRVGSDAEPVSHPSNFITQNEQVENSTGNPWLVIGIPTVPRRKGADYLSSALRRLVEHFPSVRTDPMFERIRVVVFNSKKSSHGPFEENRIKYQSGPWKNYFDFVENTERVTKTPKQATDLQKKYKKEVLERGGRPPSLPDGRVVQQTRDVVSLLEYVSDTYESSYYMFMEDDFILCKNGLEAIHRVINRATQINNNWLGIRASFGLNGIIVPGFDLPELSEYLSVNQARRPPDHLLSEFLLGETPKAAEYKGSRVNVGFRYNILEHIGEVSTLRNKPFKTEFPGCWAALRSPVLFHGEEFKEEMCANDDIWPCKPQESCDESSQLCFPNGTRPPLIFHPIDPVDDKIKNS